MQLRDAVDEYTASCLYKLPWCPKSYVGLAYVGSTCVRVMCRWISKYCVAVKIVCHTETVSEDLACPKLPYHNGAVYRRSPPPPLPPVGHIWDVMLVWRKGNINKNCLCYSIVYYYNGAQRYKQLLKVGRLYRAWYSSLSSKHLCVFGLNLSIYLSKKSRLGRRKCRNTTRAPNNVN